VPDNSADLPYPTGPSSREQPEHADKSSHEEVNQPILHGVSWR
jgi:hypothetical protein